MSLSAVTWNPNRRPAPAPRSSGGPDSLGAQAWLHMASVNPMEQVTHCPPRHPGGRALSQQLDLPPRTSPSAQWLALPTS